MVCSINYHILLDHTDACLILSKWGLTLHQIPVKLEGPVYKKETILFGNNGNVKLDGKEDWGMDVVKNAMFTTVSILLF